MLTDWVKITVKTDPRILEEISPYIFEWGCQGINELTDRFEMFFEKKDWNDSINSSLFELIKKHATITKTDILFENVPAENWNENWKKNFTSFRVGKNIIIQPDWEQTAASGNETIITIAPKMAFGTGHHETTQLILKMMEGLIEKNWTVLDAGTGSAILAIYAALCGAKRIRAFDNDPQAIENAAENCALNNVSKKIELSCAVLKDIHAEAYDLIVANINRNILLELADSFPLYSKNNGLLVLSGLLITDRDEILKKYQKNWSLIKEEKMGDWLALLMRNTNA